MINVFQKVINDTPTQRLREDTEGNTRGSMKVFLKLKPSTLKALSKPLRKQKNLRYIDTKQCR